MAPKLHLDRSEYSEFLKNHNSIDQFERLFATVNALAPLVGGTGAELSFNRDLANQIALATGVDETIISGIVPKGKWDLSASATIIPAAATQLTALVFGINTVAATIPPNSGGNIPELTTGKFRFRPPLVVPTVYGVSQTQSTTLPTYRIEFVADTLLYLVVSSNFSLGTLGAYGWFQIRQVVDI